MKLTYIETEVDPLTKNSFYADLEDGYDVEIEHVSIIPFNGAIKVYHNVSEIHTDKKFPSLYLKSDIHCKSILKNIENIISAKIYPASAVSDVF